MDLLKTRFIPKFTEDTECNTRDWHDYIEPGHPEFCSDSLYVDRKTGYWYIWDHVANENVWRLYRCSTYFLWCAHMASCEIIADYLKNCKNGEEPSAEKLCECAESNINALLRNPGIITIKELPA